MAQEVTEYYLIVNGEEKGPYLQRELQKLFNSQHISPFDKVRCSDSEEWIDLIKVIEIEEPAPSFPPPPQQFSQPFVAQPQISNNTLAAILNVFFPGVGQMIQERIGTGIAFFFGTILGYMLFILPGVILHIYSIIDAANYKPTSLPTHKQF